MPQRQACVGVGQQDVDGISPEDSITSPPATENLIKRYRAGCSPFSSTWFIMELVEFWICKCAALAYPKFRYFPLPQEGEGDGCRCESPHAHGIIQRKEIPCREERKAIKEKPDRRQRDRRGDRGALPAAPVQIYEPLIRQNFSSTASAGRFSAAWSLTPLATTCFRALPTCAGAGRIFVLIGFLRLQRWSWVL